MHWNRRHPVADAYTMPSGRTWCGRYRCCRQARHLGPCEEDITLLDPSQLQAIRDSAPVAEDRVEVTGNIVVHHPGGYVPHLVVDAATGDVEQALWFQGKVVGTVRGNRATVTDEEVAKQLRAVDVPGLSISTPAHGYAAYGWFTWVRCYCGQWFGPDVERTSQDNLQAHIAEQAAACDTDSGTTTTQR